jgi:hypothetical protein
VSNVSRVFTDIGTTGRHRRIHRTAGRHPAGIAHRNAAGTLGAARVAAPGPEHGRRRRGLGAAGARARRRRAPTRDVVGSVPWCARARRRRHARPARLHDAVTNLARHNRREGRDDPIDQDLLHLSTSFRVVPARRDDGDVTPGTPIRERRRSAAVACQRTRSFGPVALADRRANIGSWSAWHAAMRYAGQLC